MILSVDDDWMMKITAFNNLNEFNLLSELDLLSLTKSDRFVVDSLSESRLIVDSLSESRLKSVADVTSTADHQIINIHH
jgi:hypothetical protein